MYEYNKEGHEYFIAIQLYVNLPNLVHQSAETPTGKLIESRMLHL
jgi:hypothetical protein